MEFLISNFELFYSAKAISHGNKTSPLLSKFLYGTKKPQELVNFNTEPTVESNGYEKKVRVKSIYFSIKIPFHQINEHAFVLGWLVAEKTIQDN